MINFPLCACMCVHMCVHACAYVCVCVCSGYLLRFSKSKRNPDDLVYLITTSWFQTWKEYTGYKVCLCAHQATRYVCVCGICVFGICVFGYKVCLCVLCKVCCSKMYAFMGTYACTCVSVCVMCLLCMHSWARMHVSVCVMCLLLALFMHMWMWTLCARQYRQPIL